MSIALLVQANTELRRLAVAGSKLAAGDFRLKRLVEPLQAAGAKAPVFAKVAGSLHELLEAKPEDSAGKLLQASTLIGAVLYTQGQTAIAGDAAPVSGDETAVLPTKEISARRLRPVLEAMSTTGSGRHEVIESAFKEGLFADLRLMEPAIRHLNDPYPPVADLIADKILPSFGPRIVPHMREQVDPKGGSASARALRVVHALEGEDALPLLTEILDDGNAEMKIAAINCLAAYDSAVGLLKEQTAAKNKDVRRAALHALGDRGDGDILELLITALCGKDSDAAVVPIRANRSAELSERLVTTGAQLRDAVLGKKVTAEDLRRFNNCLRCLAGRKDAAVISFFIECFAQRDKLAAVPEKGYLSGGDLIDHLVAAMAESGDVGLRGELVSAIADLEGEALQNAVAMVMGGDAGEAFAVLAPYLEPLKDKKPKRNAATKRSKEILAAIEGCMHRQRRGSRGDARWLDLALAINHNGLILLCARPGHAACLKRLHGMLGQVPLHQADDVIAAMIACEAKDALECFCATVRKWVKQSGNHRWYMWHLLRLIPQFGAAALPTLDSLAAELPDDLTMQMLEYLQPLRVSTEPES